MTRSKDQSTIRLLKLLTEWKKQRSEQDGSSMTTTPESTFDEQPTEFLHVYRLE